MTPETINDLVSQVSPKLSPIKLQVFINILLKTSNCFFFFFFHQIKKKRRIKFKCFFPKEKKEITIGLCFFFFRFPVDRDIEY